MGQKKRTKNNRYSRKLTFCGAELAAYRLQLSTVLASNMATVIGPTPEIEGT